MVLDAVCLYFYVTAQSRVAEVLYVFFYYVEIISAGLAVFNLFPIPPLDGSKVVFSLLPDEMYLRLMRYERYGMMLLMVLLFTGLLDTPLVFLRDGLLSGLQAVGSWPIDLLAKFYR